MRRILTICFVIFGFASFAQAGFGSKGKKAASFFNEESPALQRLSQDVARSLVSTILEGF